MAILPFEGAMARLRRLSQSESDPKLDDGDLADIIELAKIPDRFGVLPSYAGWEPTFDMDRAAADAWETKAAKAAGDHDFQADGASYSASQVAEHCLAQAKMYRDRGVASSGGGSTGSRIVVNG